MRKLVIWLFWNTYYLCRPAPSTLAEYIKYGMRTRWPWRKFRPCIWHNDDGNAWHVYFTDEQDYTKPQTTIRVDCHIGMESGDIVGLTVWDETLRAADAAEEGE